MKKTINKVREKRLSQQFRLIMNQATLLNTRLLTKTMSVLHSNHNYFTPNSPAPPQNPISHFPFKTNLPKKQKKEPQSKATVQNKQ